MKKYDVGGYVACMKELRAPYGILFYAPQGRSSGDLGSRDCCIDPCHFWGRAYNHVVMPDTVWNDALGKMWHLAARSDMLQSIFLEYATREYRIIGSVGVIGFWDLLIKGHIRPLLYTKTKKLRGLSPRANYTDRRLWAKLVPTFAD
jgi:hypothetical protein